MHAVVAVVVVVVVVAVRTVQYYAMLFSHAACENGGSSSSSSSGLAHIAGGMSGHFPNMVVATDVAAVARSTSADALEPARCPGMVGSTGQSAASSQTAGQPVAADTDIPPHLRKHADRLGKKQERQRAAYAANREPLKEHMKERMKAAYAVNPEPQKARMKERMKGASADNPEPQ